MAMNNSAREAPNDIDKDFIADEQEAILSSIYKKVKVKKISTLKSYYYTVANLGMKNWAQMIQERYKNILKQCRCYSENGSYEKIKQIPLKIMENVAKAIKTQTDAKELVKFKLYVDFLCKSFNMLFQGD